MKLQTLMAAVALALALGFGGGYYTNSWFAAAKQGAQARAELQQSAANLLASTRQSTRIDTVLDADAARINHIRQAAAARVARYQPQPELHDAANIHPGVMDSAAPHVAMAAPETDCRAAGLVLDAGTVRLLNAARRGRAVDTAGGGDGAEPAAADAGR